MKNVNAVQRAMEDFGSTKFFEMAIMLDDKKIGYAEVFVAYDEDGDETSAYVKSIEIYEAYRNNGYGTAILKKFAQEHGGIYIYPDNEGAKRLYEKLGEEIENIPYELQAEYDESGIMFYISA